MTLLQDILRIEQTIWNHQETCKDMLETIPLTDDAMSRWILYLEIQAQQQHEEQFRHLKVRKVYERGYM